MASRGIRFGSHLKELRIHLCQTGKPSEGVRDFINKHYVSIKEANPKFPILIRECSGVQPKVYARFEKGNETSRSLTDLSEEKVLQQIQDISSKA